MNCNHYKITTTYEKECRREDGAFQRFVNNECSECNEKWRELAVKSSNISTQKYIEHLTKVEHSKNSPMRKVVKEENYARSGERYPDTYVDYEECSICLKWTQQKHQEIK